MVSTWTKDYDLSKTAEPIQNAVYRREWGEDIQIVRERAGDLDRLSHVDVTITLPRAGSIRGQEKALRNKWKKYNTITFEYYQNRFTEEKGEWFHCDAHFYLSGYLSEDCSRYEQYIIVNLANLRTWIYKEWSEDDLSDHVKPTSHSNASFIWIDVDEIPDGCIIAKSEA